MTKVFKPKPILTSISSCCWWWVVVIEHVRIWGGGGWCISSLLLNLLSHWWKKKRLNEDPSSDFSFPEIFNHRAVLRTEATLTFLTDPFERYGTCSFMKLLTFYKTGIIINVEWGQTTAVGFFTWKDPVFTAFTKLSTGLGIQKDPWAGERPWSSS